jgi:hypothetical protein
MAREQSGNILPNEPSRSEFIDDPRHLVEQPGTLSGEPGALAGDTQVLAGEPAAYQVHGREVVRPALTDVREPLCAREVTLEHGAALLVQLHLPYRPVACPLEPEVEAADAGEQAPDPHRGVSFSAGASPRFAWRGQ